MTTRKISHAMLLAATVGCLLASPSLGQVRISQVGIAAGTNMNAYDGKFIELYNAGAAPVSLAGKSLQWSSTPNGGWSSSNKLDLQGTIAPGGYWLVRATLNTWAFTTPYGIPFTADQTWTFSNGTTTTNAVFGEACGKVALVDSTAVLSTSCPAGLLDLVSWTTPENNLSGCYEGPDKLFIPRVYLGVTPAGAVAVLRKCGGLVDTNNNAADFITTQRMPRNSAYAGLVDAPAVESLAANPAVVAEYTGDSYGGGLMLTMAYAGQTMVFTSAPTTCAGTITGVQIDLSTIGGSANQAMFDDGTHGDVAAGDGKYTFTYVIPSPTTAPLGTYYPTITATDSNGKVGTGKTNVTVAPVPPSNDSCATPQVIPSGPRPVSVSVQGNLVSATPSARVATPCTNNTGYGGTSRDVWYSFTPLQSDTYTISTCNLYTAPSSTNFLDTVLTLHNGCPTSLYDVGDTTLACNDENNGCGNSVVLGGPARLSSIPLTGGQTYLIRVARYGSGSGVLGKPFQLDITSDNLPPACNPADIAQIGTGLNPDGSRNPDGLNTVDDLIVFLSAFFGNNLAAADFVSVGGDPTSDGALTVDDLIYFLSQFFAPCI